MLCFYKWSGAGTAEDAADPRKVNQIKKEP
jgi:hypothetical protein